MARGDAGRVRRPANGEPESVGGTAAWGDAADFGLVVGGGLKGGGLFLRDACDHDLLPKEFRRAGVVILGGLHDFQPGLWRRGKGTGGQGQGEVGFLCEGRLLGSGKDREEEAEAEG